MEDTNAESMSKSLTVQAGNLRPHLGQDVVHPSIQTDNESLKKQLLVLTALFQALLNNTHSGDVRMLAVYQACGTLKDVMDEEEVKQIAVKFLKHRRNSIIDEMF